MQCCYCHEEMRQTTFHGFDDLYECDKCGVRQRDWNEIACARCGEVRSYVTRHTDGTVTCWDCEGQARESKAAAEIELGMHLTDFED